VRPGFEGGQMPLQRRVPKRGFTNLFKKEYALVNLRDLGRFEANATLDIDTLKNAGLVKRSKDGVKILGNGDISVPLVLRVNRVTKPAREKIEAAGGSVELV
jgi:large subunit ribosomal protein L15